MIVPLPWPADLLWPNKRGNKVNHHALAAVKRKARSDAGFATITARGERKAFQHDGPIPIKLLVWPKRFGPHPDRDNCVAAVKVQLDAIAEQLGVNDRDFLAPVVEFCTPRVGKMEVHVG